MKHLDLFDRSSLQFLFFLESKRINRLLDFVTGKNQHTILMDKKTLQVNLTWREYISFTFRFEQVVQAVRLKK